MATKRSTARRPVGRPAGAGDVRDDLLRAALRLLEDGVEPQDVTVAALIAEAGCSPPALYHYWPTREALLFEASALGYATFRSGQREAVADRVDPIERIRLRGAAYLDFALSRPSLFRVLFLTRPHADAPGADPTAPGAGFRELVADVASAMDAGLLRRDDPTSVAVALWSAVHGVAALWTSAPGPPVDLARRIAEIQQRALLAGLAP